AHPPESVRRTPVRSCISISSSLESDPHSAPRTNWSAGCEKGRLNHGKFSVDSRQRTRNECASRRDPHATQLRRSVVFPVQQIIDLQEQLNPRVYLVVSAKIEHSVPTRFSRT